MRAVVLKYGRLEVRDTPDPVPREGELLVRTLAAGICASDIHYMDHPDPSNKGGMFLWDDERDTVMGHEFVGEVVGLGPGCRGEIEVGTWVTSMPTLARAEGPQVIGHHPDAPGAFGELFVVSEAMARSVPAGADRDAVALTDAFAVGEGYVAVSGITPGQLPVVVGAGAIGLSAVAALAARGISPVLVADMKDDRLEVARRFGAGITVNPRSQSVYERWAEVAAERNVTSPAYIYECVGAEGLLRQIVDDCPYGAKIFAAGGWYTGDTLDVTRATRKGVSIQFGGSPAAASWYATLDSIVSGRLDPRPSIGLVIDLDGVPAAIDQVRKASGPPRIIVHPNG